MTLVDILHGEGGQAERGGYPVLSAPFARYLTRRIVVSRYLRDWLYEHHLDGGRPIHVIHNGTDVVFDEERAVKRSRVRTALNLPSSSVVISYIGRLALEKRPQLMVEVAAKMLLRGGHDFYFLIAGDGPLMDEILEDVRQLGVGERVKILGAVEDADGIVCASDVICLLSEMEGLPLILLEALARGTLTISPDIGGIAEVISHGESGLLVWPSDRIVEEVVEGISGALRAPEWRIGMVERGQQVVRERFSRDRMIGDYMRILGLPESDS